MIFRWIIPLTLASPTSPLHESRKKLTFYRIDHHQPVLLRLTVVEFMFTSMFDGLKYRNMLHFW